MTEYDYSPEAYERYIATQHRIANWVDKTEQHRAQFEDALRSVPTASPPSRPGPTPLVPNHRSSRRSSSHPYSMHHQQQQQQHGHRPRDIYIPPHSPASESSDDYGDGPGPMPLTSPGMMMYPSPQQPQQPAYPSMAQPMMSPPLIMVPPPYLTTPHHKSSHHHHRSSHPHSQPRSYSLQPQAYYNMASPPVSAGYPQYPFPQMVQGGHPGYIMMQPQQRQFSARPQLPLMARPSGPSRSASPDLASFPVLPPSAALVPNGVGGYLQARPYSAEEPSSESTSSPSPGSESDTTGTVSPTKQAHYFASIPQYQGIHSAMASPPLHGHVVPGPTQPNLIPQNVYNHTSDNRHHLRQSFG